MAGKWSGGQFIDAGASGEPLSPADRDHGLPGLLAPIPLFSVSGSTLVANRAYLARVCPSRDIEITSVKFEVRTADAANPTCDVGFYDAGRNRLQSTGAVAGILNSTGFKTIDVANIVLEGGTDYYVALSSTSAGVAVLTGTNIGSGFAQIFGTTNSIQAYKDTCHPLASTAPDSGGIAAVPIFALVEA